MRKNFSYLALLNVLNLLLPLVTYPYLISILGVGKYGEVMWVWAIAQIFVVVAKFGLDSLGVKLIARARSNAYTLSRTFSEIIIFRLASALLCSSVFLLTMLIFDTDGNRHALVYFFTFLVLFEALIPTWYFQGIEDMRSMAITLSSVKMLFVAFVFIFIKNESHYIYVPLMFATSAFLSNLLAFGMIFFGYRTGVVKPNLNKIYKMMKDGAAILFATSGSVVRDKFTIILIERSLGFEMVGFFDLAIRLVNIILVPFFVVNQVVFPYVARTLDMHFFSLSLLAMVILSVVTCAIFAVSTPLVGQLLAIQEPSFFDILNALVFIVPFAVISALVGNNVIVILEKTEFLIVATFLSITAYVAVYVSTSGANHISFVLMMLAYFVTDATLRLICGLYLLYSRYKLHV